jgi:protein-L-isoaspartate(D-aspartate) O-methyltransferase
MALTGFALLLLSCTSPQDEVFMADPSRQTERDAMIADQIIPRGITDPGVIAAMRHVPRHRFVPDSHARLAYADSPLPIGHGQTISQPAVVAFMTEALALQGREKVLEIGTGSGYQAAVLAELASTVFTIELVEPLARQAERRLMELGYANVTVRAGDGYRGWPEEAPFDAIIVTAATDQVPQPLLDQLAIGGRLILPLGASFQKLTLYRRTQDGYERTELIPVRFVPLLREERMPQANGP